MYRVGCAVIAGWVSLLSACSAVSERLEPPVRDPCAFKRDVYPVLARDCGFPACHGNPARFFRVFSPGRVRLDPDTPLLAAATPDEVMDSFERARSMLAAAPTPEASLLLRKPLDPAAGGGAHLGVDAFGRDVYASREEPGWVALQTWARGEGEVCP